MVNLEWCKKQVRGLKKVEPSSEQRILFGKASEDAYSQFNLLEGPWQIVMSYFACYYAVYAIAQKCGINSHLHECTFAIMPILGFKKAECEFLDELNEKRLKAQYHLVKQIAPTQAQIAQFLLKAQEVDKNVLVSKVRIEIFGEGTQTEPEN